MDVADVRHLIGLPVRLRLADQPGDALVRPWRDHSKIYFRRGILREATDAVVVIDGYRDCCTEEGSPEIMHNRVNVGWDDLAEIRLWND